MGKRLPALETEVDVLYRTTLPAPFSQEEMQKILTNAATGCAQNSPLTLIVYKKKVLLKHFTDKKPVISIRRKSLDSFKQLPEADCLLVSHKVKGSKQELFILRFANLEGLERFQVLFNAMPPPRRDVAVRPQALVSREHTPLTPIRVQEERHVQQAPLMIPQPQSSKPSVERPVTNSQRVTTLSQEATRPPKTQRRSRSTQPIPKQKEMHSEVYLIKRVSRSKDRRGRVEYSRVTIYDLNSSPSSQNSRFSSSRSSSSPSSKTSISGCGRP